MMEMRLIIRGIRKHENVLYLIPGLLNGIIQIDLITYKTQYIDICQKKQMVGQDLLEDILVSENLVWCSPCMENQITVYDSSNGGFSFFPLPKLKERGRNLYRCGHMLDMGKNIIMLPSEYPGILKISKSDFNIEAIEWKEGLYQQDKGDLTQFALAKEYEIVDDTIYLLDANYILKYNQENNNIRYIKLCSEYKNFTGIVRFQDKFILLDRFHAELYEWTEETGNLKKIDIDLGFRGLDTEKEEGDGCPVGLVRAKDRIIILLAASQYLYLLNEEYRIEKIALAMENIEKFESKWHYRCYEFDGRNLYLPICYENKILIIDTDTWNQKCVQINLSENAVEDIFTYAMTADKPMTENNMFYSLERFINRLK